MVEEDESEEFEADGEEEDETRLRLTQLTRVVIFVGISVSPIRSASRSHRIDVRCWQVFAILAHFAPGLLVLTAILTVSALVPTPPLASHDGVTIVRLPLLAGATNSSAGALRERRRGPGAAGWQDPAFAASSAAGAVPVHLDLCWRGAVRTGRAGHPLHPHTATASCARLQGRRDQEAHLEMIDECHECIVLYTMTMDSYSEP